METLCGMELSSWSDNSHAVRKTGKRVQLQLAPDCPVVIGRSENHLPPYLNPAYHPTRIVPGSGQTIVKSGDTGPDTSVSRAHFMLRGNAGGIMLTNGVPHIEGGIRPPTNGTWMVEPIRRLMEPGEEYLIEHGAHASISLPNGTVVRICTE